tara:strand:+ start:4194 stop:4703 length:510 start_codon:yes stop_codon:yes gene_type:complete
MAYADADDLVARFDANVIGDMAADDGKTIAESDLGSDTKVTAALASASGLVNAAVQQGNRYTTADLTALTGDDLAFLKDIVCRVAYVNLDARKQYPQENENTNAMKQWVSEMLKHLREGYWVFGVSEVKDAGVIKVDTVTRVEIRDNWELWVDRGRGHIYPTRRTYKRR